MQEEERTPILKASQLSIRPKSWRNAVDHAGNTIVFTAVGLVGGFNRAKSNCVISGTIAPPITSIQVWIQHPLAVYVYCLRRVAIPQVTLRLDSKKPTIHTIQEPKRDRHLFRRQMVAEHNMHEIRAGESN